VDSKRPWRSGKWRASTQKEKAITKATVTVMAARMTTARKTIRAITASYGWRSVVRRPLEHGEATHGSPALIGTKNPDQNFAFRS
jgi:hypothetical protein